MPMKIKTSMEQIDVMGKLQELPWCKPSWSYPSVEKETKEMLTQCINLPSSEQNDDLDDFINRSNVFPVPFPIDTVRLVKLKERRPEERLKRNILSTYTVIHERVLILMTEFLKYKREFGSDIERALYKNMTVPQLIDRILKKRSAAFLTAKDKYKLVTGEKGADGWESVGTSQERPPLVLQNCLSYDEMKLSALVYVSGYTECINDGARKNCGVVETDNIEEGAVIIGVIGARFKRVGRMDCEDILVTKEQNTAENGYGQDRRDVTAKSQWRKMWADFYEVPSYTYDELMSSLEVANTTKELQYTSRLVKISPDVVFDNEPYYKRMVILVETTLLEAAARGRAAGKDVYLNVICAGLGVWKASKHQEDVFILVFLERTRELLTKGLLDHVTDVNFAYIKPGRSVGALFKVSSDEGKASVPRLFLDSAQHPRGGINVHLESREPTSKLGPAHAGKLLVITYPWDGNAHPGNEFWIGKLSSSGDPAAACSTQVSELHNAHINTALSGCNVRVATRTGLTTLTDCCRTLTEQ